MRHQNNRGQNGTKQTPHLRSVHTGRGFRSHLTLTRGDELACWVTEVPAVRAWGAGWEMCQTHPPPPASRRCHFCVGIDRGPFPAVTVSLASRAYTTGGVLPASTSPNLSILLSSKILDSLLETPFHWGFQIKLPLPTVCTPGSFWTCSLCLY